MKHLLLFVWLSLATTLPLLAMAVVLLDVIRSGKVTGKTLCSFLVWGELS